LLALNGLRWPVATNGTHIQIGCQHHSVAEWESFDNRTISAMDVDAAAFWKANKQLVLALAKSRAE
jgi:hypothetical protein